MEKIDDEKYPLAKVGEFSESGQLSQFNISGSDGKADEKIDLTNLGLTEGVYKMTLKAYDVNENVVTKDFFFVYDDKAPAKIENFVESRTHAGKGDLSWNSAEEADFEKIVIKVKNKTNETEIIPDYEIMNQTQFEEQIDLVDLNQYEYSVYVYDLLGNVSEVTKFVDDKKPSPLKNQNEARSKRGEAELTWNKPAEEDFNKDFNKIKVKRTSNLHTAESFNFRGYTNSIRTLANM